MRKVERVRVDGLTIAMASGSSRKARANIRALVHAAAEQARKELERDAKKAKATRKRG